MNSVEIGNIHPAFFEVHKLFSNFRKVYLLDCVLLENLQVKLKYEAPILYGEDLRVLEDFKEIFKKLYGSSISRNYYFKLIDWVSIPEYVNEVNVGVCLLKDDYYSGWDGKPNSIWYDNNIPGRVINKYYSFWVYKKLHDSYLLEEKDLNLKDVNILPNLVYSKAMVDEGKKSRVDSLIKFCIKNS